MKPLRVAPLTGRVLALFAAPSQAQVQISGVHLCCGACAKAIGEVLKDIDGVSGASCDRDSKTVTFAAAGDDAMEAGLAALSKAGFYGTARLGNRDLKFPTDKVEKDA